MSSNSESSDPGWLMVILASPSGAGKTTLKNRLLVEFPDLRFSISHTTRHARAHEQQDREYHFVDREEFEGMIKEGAFVEYARVHDNYYGTSRKEIAQAQKSHRGIVFDIDVQGARQIVSHFPEALTVFLLPPSMKELEQRLRSRADESEGSIRQRLTNARLEIEHYSCFDYLIVNDQVDLAAQNLFAIVRAERVRRRRMAQRAEELLDSLRPAR
jgi:guanylate kinase